MIKTQAFILRTLSYSDADLIIHALSKEHGLVHFFARSAKKSKKRFSGGVLEVPNLIEAEHGPLPDDSKKLVTLKDARLLNGFDSLRTNYSKLNTIYLMIKITLLSEAGHEDLFNLFGGALKTLPLVSEHKRFFTHFLVRYLYIEGVLPQKLEFEDYIKTPLTYHNEVTKISEEAIQKEIIMAKHYLNTYLNKDFKVDWPQ